MSEQYNSLTAVTQAVRCTVPTQLKGFFRVPLLFQRGAKDGQSYQFVFLRQRPGETPMASLTIAKRARARSNLLGYDCGASPQLYCLRWYLRSSGEKEIGSTRGRSSNAEAMQIANPSRQEASYLRSFVAPAGTSAYPLCLRPSGENLELVTIRKKFSWFIVVLVRPSSHHARSQKKYSVMSQFPF